MKIRLVVAKYREDLTWLNQIVNHGLDVIIYDKSDISLNKSNDYVKVSDNYFKLPNIGREAHTYIKHIVENYDDLYDVEVFSQGGVYDHVPDFWNKVEILKYNKFDFWK